MNKVLLKFLTGALALVLCLSAVSCASDTKQDEAKENVYLGVTDYIIGSDDILRLNSETPQERLDALAVGDVVALGSYNLDNNAQNGKEDITWRVLAIENGKALIISELCIDAMHYNAEKSAVTWETSDLREKLNFGNESFYETAFSDDEKAYVLLSDVVNEDSPIHDMEGGNDTQDFVFVLSFDEAEEYFADDELRIAKASATAVANGGQCFDSRTKTAAEADPDSAYEYMALSWWLRTPGGGEEMVSDVLYFGQIDSTGVRADLSVRGVRPVMWVKTVNEIIPEKVYTPNDWEIVKVGEKVSLGLYEQDGDSSSKEEIIWQVLKVEDGKATLISEKILDRVLYYNFAYSTAANAGATDWENSDLRKWLNSEFKSAFSAEELGYMVEVTLDNSPHALTGAGGCADTLDLVYALSSKEVEQLIPNAADRMTRPTKAAEANGVYVDTQTRCGDWWLRDSGETSNKAKNVFYYGAIDSVGKLVKNDYIGVRPVITVDLTK